MTDHTPYDKEWMVERGGEGIPYQLDAPLNVDEPTVIRLDGDPFHPSIPHEYTAAVYGVMAACPQHTFQVVTEHPGRAWEFFEWVEGRLGKITAHMRQYVYPDGVPEESRGFGREVVSRDWPLPHVMLGVRATDQSDADARIPPLLECPAVGRFVDIAVTEPIDLDRYLWGGPMACECGGKVLSWESDFCACSNPRHRTLVCPECGDCACHIADRRDRGEEWVDSKGRFAQEYKGLSFGRLLDWAILRGSGTDDVWSTRWMTHLRADFESVDTPVYVRDLAGRPGKPLSIQPDKVRLLGLDHPHGADIDEWPEGLRVREMPEVVE